MNLRDGFKLILLIKMELACKKGNFRAIENCIINMGGEYYNDNEDHDFITCFTAACKGNHVLLADYFYTKHLYEDDISISRNDIRRQEIIDILCTVGNLKVLKFFMCKWYYLDCYYEAIDEIFLSACKFNKLNIVAHIADKYDLDIELIWMLNKLSLASSSLQFYLKRIKRIEFERMTKYCSYYLDKDDYYQLSSQTRWVYQVLTVLRVKFRLKFCELTMHDILSDKLARQHVYKYLHFKGLGNDLLLKISLY